MASKKGGKGADERIKSGRSISPGGRKSKESTRSTLRQLDRAASGAASADGRRQKFVIWPEWSDADINAEKWEVAHKGKEKEKGKSPVAQHFFDDPDGKIILPPSLAVSHWKRPQEFITDKTPVVVDPDRMFGFELMSANDHVLHCETLRWIISQINELWQICATKATGNEPAEVPVSPDGTVYQWRPWEHIYAMTKVGKGPNIPQYNPYGKYAVKLFWMGCWRKLVVDDTIPFDDNDQCLLPSTALSYELWPLLLAKALIKVASLDYGGGSGNTEFGDFSVVHCLTGWLPQTILVKKGNEEAIWRVLANLLPEWKLPEPGDKDGLVDGEDKKEIQSGSTPDGEKLSDGKEAPQTAKDKAKDKKDDKGKDKGKDGGKDKKDKEKDKGKEKTVDEQIVYEKPEIVVFASYHDVNKKNPFSILSLSEMADRSEKLRLQGLSHLYSHPVLLNQIRACPLTPPPPPEVIPAWKLIRPRVDRQLPTSEEQYQEPEVKQPIRCLQLQSSFLNYKVSPMPISTSTSRPRSALHRGGTRPSTPPQPTLAEAEDENAPEPDPQAEAEKAAAAAAAAAAAEEAERQKKAQQELEAQALAAAAAATERAEARSRSARYEKRASKTRSSVSKGMSLEVPDQYGPSSSRVSSARSRHSIVINAPAASATDSKRAGKKTSIASTKAREDGQGGKTTATPSSSAPGGLSNGVGEEMTEEEAGEEAEPAQQEAETKAMWMDIDIFCECFQAIHVYHKVHTYNCCKSFTDMKVAPVDERQPQYLFVDSLKPSVIFFCMSALCRWNEGATLPPLQSAAPKSGQKGDEGSVIDGVPVEIPKPQDILPGSMISERHFWKTILVGDLFKRMRTTGVKAISLHLPEGRHCLKLYVHAPLGYHLQLVSSTQFVYGDEEAILPQLVKEPSRLVHQAGQLMQAFGKVLSSFGDETFLDVLPGAMKEFECAHCPDYPKSGPHRIRLLEHHQVLNEAFYQVMHKALPSELLNADTTFAFRVLLMDTTSKNPFGINTTSRPATSTAASGRGSARAKSELRKRESDAAQAWSSKDPTCDELISIVKIQKGFRGALARKVFHGRIPKTPEHQRAAESMQKIWTALEPNAESVGLQLLKAIFRIGPHLLPHYSVASDIRNFISYTDYNGSYADQPANHWFVVFREVFNVPSTEESCLMLPKLICPIPTCCLRIIDNDTGDEIERSLGERNPPHHYKRNRTGYTIVAVARSLNTAVPSGKWRLRLIGSGPMLQPVRNDLCANFYSRDLHDYYVARENGLLFRQVVRVADDHLVSIHLSLSKPDVPVRLSILDQEEELLATSGKGQAVLPAFIFQKDNTGEGEETRTSSRQSQRAAAGNKKRSSGSARSPSQRQLSTSFQFQSNSDRQSSAVSGAETNYTPVKSHKYVIQATIDRTAWPLSSANWTFIRTLRQQEKEELKTDYVDNTQSEVFGKPRDPSPPKPAAASEKKDGGKGGKGGKGGGKGDKGKGNDKGKDTGSRPESVTFDMTKAHWTMRIVSDNSLAEEIQVRRDTERAEQIRAMKKAWEDVEPGRAERARQSRLRFLNANMVTLETKDENGLPPEAEVGTDEVASLAPESATAVTGAGMEVPMYEESLTLEPSAHPSATTQKEMLNPIDRSRYLVGDPLNPVYKDYETRVNEEMEAKKAALDAHRQFMDDWDNRLVEDRKNRNKKKLQQIEDAYKIQGDIDAYREAYFRQREAYRQKLLGEERRKQEELAAAEAASQADADAKPKSPRGKKGSARASAKKGKKK